MNDDLVCNYSDTLATDIVFCDKEISVKAHRDLFKMDPAHYVLCDTPTVNCLKDSCDSAGRIQLALTWRNVLSIALWKEHINIGEVILLLKDTGLNDSDLKPFKGGDINDIFPVLYYGKNFDILRKVCNTAKRAAQDKLRKSGVQINCHLISEETGRIVASSL